MSDLNALEQEVDDLDTLSSSIFRYRDVYRNIEAATKNNTNSHKDRLLLIVNDFRVKIPNLVTFNRIRADATDIAHTLMLATLDERIERINSRNELLARLTGSLQTEIDKGNADAELLKKIKSGVDKATATVAEIKELIDQLTDTSVGNKEKFAALVNAISNISNIFTPNNA
jgi:hypothetical protein